MISYISRAGTLSWRWICWCAATLFLVIVYPLVLCGLVLYLLPDLFQKRESKPSISQPRNRRRLCRLTRDGSEISIEYPDGSTVVLEPLEVSILQENVSSVVAGAYVYEKTKL